MQIIFVILVELSWIGKYVILIFGFLIVFNIRAAKGCTQYTMYGN